ncbi:MAG: hypothetical protein MZV49_18965 [Rhodopseudomonas palustris]|nr:hypothetical protein [Rhodopseudomonas palustris]
MLSIQRSTVLDPIGPSKDFNIWCERSQAMHPLEKTRSQATQVGSSGQIEIEFVFEGAGEFIFGGLGMALPLVSRREQMHSQSPMTAKGWR